jgi:hypothetical protein
MAPSRTEGRPSSDRPFAGRRGAPGSPTGTFSPRNDDRVRTRSGSRFAAWRVARSDAASALRSMPGRPTPRDSRQGRVVPPAGPHPVRDDLSVPSTWSGRRVGCGDVTGLPERFVPPNDHRGRFAVPVAVRSRPVGERSAVWCRVRRRDPVPACVRAVRRRWEERRTTSGSPRPSRPLSEGEASVSPPFGSRPSRGPACEPDTVSRYLRDRRWSPLGSDRERRTHEHRVHVRRDVVLSAPRGEVRPRPPGSRSERRPAMVGSS